MSEYQQISEADLLQQKRKDGQKDQMTAQIVPVTQHILDNYTMLAPLKKGRFRKLVMKTATAYRLQGDVMTVNSYPNPAK